MREKPGKRPQKPTISLRKPAISASGFLAERIIQRFPKEAQFITDGAAQAQDVNVLFGNNHELDSYALKPRHQLQPNAFDEPSAYVGIYKTSQSSPRPQEE